MVLRIGEVNDYLHRLVIQHRFKRRVDGQLIVGREPGRAFGNAVGNSRNLKLRMSAQRSDVIIRDVTATHECDACHALKAS